MYQKHKPETRFQTNQYENECIINIWLSKFLPYPRNGRSRVHLQVDGEHIQSLRFNRQASFLGSSTYQIL